MENIKDEITPKVYIEKSRKKSGSCFMLTASFEVQVLKITRRRY
jgi:hypothetical protein